MKSRLFTSIASTHRIANIAEVIRPISFRLSKISNSPNVNNTSIQPHKVINSIANEMSIQPIRSNHRLIIKSQRKPINENY